MSAGDVAAITENFFRQESGRLVSSLVRVFGTEHMQLAEDVVQEALVKAIRTWPYSGVPENPSAWITLVAKNLALDAVRRHSLARKKETQMFGSAYKWSAEVAAEELATVGTAIEDDVLRMLLVCCHPEIPEDTQPLLALKMVCAFSVGEIANAFLSSEAAVLKRITRAKDRLREFPVPMELVLGDELSSRIDSVLRTLYLLFNEGYKGTSGRDLVRADLCEEAIRLGGILARHGTLSVPKVDALLALMCFNLARLPARAGSGGEFVRLADQDRTAWDREAIARGMAHLAASQRGEKLSSYHVQATIAALHTTAASYEETDWVRVSALYETLLEIEPSPTAGLGRAVAVSHVFGPEAGLSALEEIPNRYALVNYYLLYAVTADFQAQLGQHEAAMGNLRRALDLATNDAERRELLARIEGGEERHVGLA